jgi:hypothetical protein
MQGGDNQINDIIDGERLVSRIMLIFNMKRLAQSDEQDQIRLAISYQ